LTRNQAPNIPSWSSEIPGLGLSRGFVRSIYEADLGEVLKPERIESNYVVAAVTEVLEEGTMSAEKARPSVEPMLRNRKKAAAIQAKIGAITTLEAAATALGGKTIEVGDSLRITGTQNVAIGFEPRVLGVAFNPANQGKVVSTAIPGLAGVFVVRVDQQSTTPVLAGDIQEQRKARTEQAKQALSNQYSPNNPLSILRNAAEVKDYRSKRY
jgi:peptidyl-prolyl cis-trans isomerase D